MPTLRHVWVWPAMGFPDRPWLDHPDEDAFARSATTVFEAYSQAVRAARIPARHSELRLTCRHDAGRDDVLVMVHPETTEGFETAVVSLPAGIAAMTPPARARLVLTVLDAAATRLGRARGWDLAALAAARAQVLAAGLRHRWDGPARTSPDRRWVARPRYVVVDDGYGRAVVEVRHRADGALVCTSPVVATWGHHSALVRHARTVQWCGRTRVQFRPDDGVAVGPAGTVGGSDREPIVVDLSDPATFGAASGLPAPAPADVAESDMPVVTVRTPADLGPRIDVIGGGPVNGVPDAYLRTLHALLDQLLEPPWRSWWSPADRTVLQISYDFAAAVAGTGLSVRRKDDALHATIRRPASTFAVRHDHAATARRDVETMVAAVRRRMGLPEHPALRP